MVPVPNMFYLEQESRQLGDHEGTTLIAHIRFGVAGAALDHGCSAQSEQWN